MTQNPPSPQNNQEGIEQVLEHILVNHDDNAKHHSALLENIIEQNAKENAVEPILENSLELQHRQLEVLKKIAERPDPKVPEVQRISIEGLSELRGHDGKTPVKGKDYFTPEEIADAIKQIQDGLRIPQDGKTPVKGEDYFTKEEIQSIIQEVVAQIPEPEDGEDGIDAFVDYPHIITEVLKLIPRPKDVPDEIKSVIDATFVIKTLKGQLSYNDLKDLPTSFKERMAGTGYLREITDISLHGLTDGQSIRWNAKTNKWENFTVSASTGVSQIIAGTNVTISPSGGTGAVTINSGDSNIPVYNEVVSGSGTSFSLSGEIVGDTLRLYGRGQRLIPYQSWRGGYYDYTWDESGNITTNDSWSAGDLLADYTFYVPPVG